MSEIIIDSVQIGSGGGTHVGTFRKELGETAVIRLERESGTVSNMDVEVTGVKADPSRSSYAVPRATISETGVDASTNDRIFRLDNLGGYEAIEITVTNNAASSGTVTLVQHDYVADSG